MGGATPLPFSLLAPASLRSPWWEKGGRYMLAARTLSTLPSLPHSALRSVSSSSL